MKASMRGALAGTLAALAIAGALVAITLTGGDDGPRLIEAGAPPTETPTPTPTATPTPTPTKAPEFNAEAKVISDAADLVDGPLTRGKLGDYRLANSEIQVVIQDIERNLHGIGQFGGQIIDADLVRGMADPERDSFQEWAFGVNLENTAHYTSLSIVNDGSNGQPAIIRATGVDDLLDFINPSSQVQGFGFPFPTAFDDADLPVTITTDYILAPNANYVEVETTVTNTDPTDDVETFFTEYLNGSGQLEIFQSGYGFGEPLATSACALCNFVAWSGKDDADGVSYGYINDIADSTTFSTSGVTIPILGVNAIQALLGVAAPNYTIPANGGEVTVTRYFAVGEDVGSIVDIRNDILGLSTGTIEGNVTRGGQPVEGVDIAVLGDPGDGPGMPKNVVAHYHTDANGDYQGTLPPGDYAVHAHLDGHLAGSPDPGNVTITESGTTTQDFTITEAGRVQVTIVDETDTSIAGKVSIVGFDAYPDPGNFLNLGLGITINTSLFGEFTKDRLPFGLAKVLFVDDGGDSGEFFLEPGDYQVVVSHGSEYSVFTDPITVTSGNLTTVNAKIAPVIDTTGFVSGDFHIHQLNSPDSAVSLNDRVISILAEGVDFITPSDHEHRTDLSSAVSSLGVGGLMSVAVNNENTTPDYGHFNAWPLTTDPSQSNNGALDWGVAAPDGQDFPSYGNYMMPPADIFANLLADPGVDTVQINHIDTFFGSEGLSVDTSYIPPQDFANNLAKRLDPSIANLFDDAFTALEVWQGSDRGNTLDRFMDQNLGDWFNMINQGIVRTGIAVSDTHKRVIDQAGFPRTFLASSTDDAGALDDSQATLEGLAGNVNNGRAIGTNGPYVEVSVEATSTGETGSLALGDPTLVSTTDGSATITVDIQSPIWAEFDTVEYYVNHVPLPDDVDNDITTPPLWRVTPDEVQTAGVDFTISTVDDFPLITDAEHLEATTTLDLTGLTEDTWVVVVVRGTDGVSEPIFPVVPNDLDQSSNADLADLTDGNLDELGVLATAFTNPLFVDVNNDDDYDPPSVDNDRDGCTNVEEMAPKGSASAGGGRSPSNFWDFADLPTGDPPTRDGAVFGADITAVVQRFGSAPSSVPTSQEAFEEALTTPPDPPAYHTAFDRTPQGPNIWNLGPPDGGIFGADINNIVQQFGHSCAAPP